MKINFSSTIYDAAGYSEFSRYFISALHRAGKDISVEPIAQKTRNIDFGEKGRLAHSLVGKNKHCDVNVVIMVPTLFQKYMKPKCKNIGFTMWEASRLPPSWVEMCNQMDAIFVPSKWNLQVFRDSGVTKPISVVWPGLDEIEPQAPNPPSAFKFYSIFQWIERKNPQALLKAYFSEFAGHDDVALYLKAYRHVSQPDNASWIKEEIEKIKKEIKISKAYPAVLVNADLLNTEQMHNVHANGDCFVLPHRAEGFGLTQLEAMAHGKPVISTQYSGVTDFMTSENSYPVSYNLTPVSHMSWYVPWFDASTMYWAEPCVYELAKTMRFVYDRRGVALDVARQGQQTAKNNFTPAKSAEMFMRALDESFA